MILAELLFVLTFAGAFVFSISYLILLAKKNFEERKLRTDAWRKIDKALEEKNKDELENTLILYNDVLEEGLKQRVSSKIDELVIDEDDNSNLKKRL